MTFEEVPSMAIPTILHCGPVHFNLRDITVEPLFFLHMFATFITVPSLQALVYFIVCIQKYNASFCQLLENATFQHEHHEKNDYVQSTTSYWFILTIVTMVIPSSMTVVLFLGSYGDKVGRKFPIMLPIIGAIVQSIANLVNALFPLAPLSLVLIGPLVSGICGGITGICMAVFSYVSHIAPPETKTIRLGIVQSMIVMSATLGFFFSGVILESTSFTFVFGFTGGLNCLALAYTAVWVDDIKPSEPVLAGSRYCGRWVVESVQQMTQFIRQPRGPRVCLTIILLVLANNVMIAIVVGEFNILLLFLRREPFAWSQTLYGYFKGMERLLNGLGLLVALPLLKQKLHAPDTILSLVGMMSKVISLALLGASRWTWMVFFAGVVSMAQAISPAAIRSMFSSLVRKDEQGRLFALEATAESLTSAAAALLFNTVYPETLYFFPGLSFIMGSALCLVGFFILLYLHRTGTAEICSAQHTVDLQ